MNTQQSPEFSNHDEISPLLPWYANGSLQGEEFNRVKAHVKVCLSCRRELVGLQNLARHLSHEPALEISPQPSFERLMARIQQQNQAQAHRVTTWQVRLKSWLAGLETPQLAFAALVLLTVLALPLLNSAALSPANFHTVADSGSRDRYSQQDISVIFAEPLGDAEKNQIIADLKAQILEGPTSNGLYTLRLNDKEKAAELNSAISKLRANPKVVFAEPTLPLANP